MIEAAANPPYTPRHPQTDTRSQSIGRSTSHEGTNTMNTNTHKLPTIIRLPEVMQTVGLSRPSVYRMMKAGTFPQQFKLGASAVGWLRAEVEQWITERARTRFGSMPEQGLALEAAAA